MAATKEWDVDMSGEYTEPFGDMVWVAMPLYDENSKVNGPHTCRISGLLSRQPFTATNTWDSPIKTPINQSINQCMYLMSWGATGTQTRSSVHSYRQDLLPTCKAFPKETTTCVWFTQSLQWISLQTLDLNPRLSLTSQQSFNVRPPYTSEHCAAYGRRH